jgi:hypothetical protein
MKKSWELLEKELKEALIRYAKDFNNKDEVNKIHLELVEYSNFKVNGGRGDIMNLGIRMDSVNTITQERSSKIILKRSSQFEHPDQLTKIDWRTPALRGLLQDMIGCATMVASAMQQINKQ